MECYILLTGKQSLSCQRGAMSPSSGATSVWWSYV